MIADTFFRRFRGLMLRKSLNPGEGLLLQNCSSIHCCFMRFSIDVVYLSEEMDVVKIETVKPWRIGSFVPGAAHVLEMEEGAGSDLRIGNRICLE